jgi:hypothetical protein
MTRQEWPPVGAVAGYFPELPPPPASLGTQAAVPVHVPPPNKPKEMRARAPGRGHDGEYGCRVPADGTKRCPQCWDVQTWPKAFDGKLNCNGCRADWKAP